MANSLVIISSLEVQIQTYTNIEKSRFLLTPNLRMLDFFWHLPPTTPPESQFSHSFEATGHSPLSCARAPEPRGGGAAAPGRRRSRPHRGCWRGLGSVFHQRVFREAPEAEGKKSVKKMISKKRTKNWRTLAFESNFGRFVWQM